MSDSADDGEPPIGSKAAFREGGAGFFSGRFDRNRRDGEHRQKLS